MTDRRSTTKFSLCGVFFLMACSADLEVTSEGTFEVEGDEIAFRGTADIGALPRAEQKTYFADRAYIAGLAPRGVAVGINHADPRQHRFALLRMKLAGKTPANSPELFRMMEALRAAHLARGLTSGTLLPITAADGRRASQHEILTTGRDADGNTFESGALASRQDQLSYGFVDSSTWDEFGNLLGDTNYVEVFGNMRFSTIQSLGHLALAEGESIEGDSFLSEVLSTTNRLHQSYVIAAPQPIADAQSLNTPIVQRPADEDDVDGNGFLVVCLDRTWTNDCEYNNTGFATLRLPLKGSVSVSGAGVVVDADAIRNYQSQAGPAPGNVFVTLGTSGGGCALPATGQGMSMKEFWRHVTATPTTMSWDLSVLGDWASFSETCRLVQDIVYLTMDLDVPYWNQVIDARGTLKVTISNAPSDRPLLPPNLQQRRPLRVTNSCLAAGTLVSVAGGPARKIEDLQIGEAVLSPYASSLTITDTAIGTERSPMVRIVDSRSRELLMTEMHPLEVAGRGMVPARLLQVGDVVRTDDGTSELVRVSREAYGGQVFNLKVGTPDEARSLGADQSAVYANGFVVGDGQIQDRVEMRALHAGEAAGRTRLSARWRKDYETSRSRAAQN